MSGWHYGDWGWGGALTGVLMLAFWAFVIFAIVWLVRQTRGRTQTPDRPAEADPRAILDRRFAAGEIDEEEYRSRRAVLTGNAHGPGRSP